MPESVFLCDIQECMDNKGVSTTIYTGDSRNDVQQKNKNKKADGMTTLLLLLRIGTTVKKR